MSATTQSTSTDVCDGDNLAIILALYWVVYLVINAVVFAGIMYGLRKCFDKVKLPGGKSKEKEKEREKERSNVSRASSRVSLVSRGKH